MKFTSGPTKYGQGCSSPMSGYIFGGSNDWLCPSGVCGGVFLKICKSKCRNKLLQEALKIYVLKKLVNEHFTDK